MKKSIIFSLIAMTFVAFTLSSCDPNNKNNGGDVQTKITGLTVKPTQLVLAIGETTRLAALTEPAGASVTITWTSSDTEVATVSNNGTVTAVGLGKATITAKSGDYSATCEVSVKSEYETINFTGAFVYYYDTTYTNKIDTLRSEAWGSQYFLAKKVLCDVMVFSEGFYYNEEVELSGADKGAILEFQAPFYWAPAWLNGGSGTIFVLGDWEISNEYPDSTTTVGKPFSIAEAEYTSAIYDFIQDYYIEEDETKAIQDLQKAAATVSGATLKIYEYHTTEEGYPSDGYYASYIPYIPDLFFGEGSLEFGDTYSASKYMLSVDAYDLQAKELLWESDTTTYEFYQYGTHLKETESSIELVDNKVHFGQEYKYQYNVSSKNKIARKGEKQARYIEIPALTETQREALRQQLDRANTIKVKK